MRTHWNVALVGAPYHTLTYAAPDYLPASLLAPGLRVAVPLARSLRCAVLTDQVRDPATESASSTASIRPILWPLEHIPLLCPEYLQLIRDVAGHSLSRPGYVLANILPRELRSIQLRLVLSSAATRQSFSLSELAGLDQATLQELARHWQEGSAKLENSGGSKSPRLVELTADPPWPVRPRAVRQKQLLEHLWTEGPMDRRSLSRALGGDVAQTIRRLAAMGLVRETEPERAGDEPRHEDRESGQEPLDGLELTREQREVCDSLAGEVQEQDLGIRLLHGVTGSGKTLVYLMLARQCLRQGRSALLLVPEIALSLQLWREVRELLPGRICRLYHGHLSPADKSRLFREISRSSQPMIVVGTRSAAFLPRTDWGLICLDEEHDASFKQEERFPYHAKEVAYCQARISKSLLLLGSATPDIKTYHAASEGHFPLLAMRNRVGQRRLPEAETVDLRSDPPQEGPFSGTAISAFRECLQRGEQAIVLLNRRGYAPLIYCTGCGRVIHCDHCEVGMTYHKSLERVVCHYCGTVKPFPLACPDCGGHQYVPLMEGTEQIEEYLSTFLGSQSRLLRLDRDSTRRRGSMENILDSFASHQAQVLVGTQMCSKGHNFPGVSLVTVLDGDIGLNLPDYRATERTFQLLQQVAGRAGRGQAPGRVLIQTRSPGHYCWDFIRKNDYQGFYNQEIELRRKRRYPPFVRLGLLRMSYLASHSDQQERIQEIAGLLKERGSRAGVSVLGPAPAPLRQLRGRVRYQCLIKASDWASIRSVCRPLFTSSGSKSGLRLSLDLDPVQML